MLCSNITPCGPNMPNSSSFESLADQATRLLFRAIVRMRRLTWGPKSDGFSGEVRPTRLTIVQFGDYLEAFERFRDGGAENYYAQRYTVDFVANLARQENIEQVTVITFGRDVPLAEVFPGLCVAGVNLYPLGRPPETSRLLAMVKATDPTHLIVGAPLVPLLEFGTAQGYRTLPLFADSFQGGGIKQRVRNAKLAFALSDPRITIVSNHNLAATLDLVRIGVDPNKVVPFDWPALISPRALAPKTAPPSGQTFRLLYVGQLNEHKGVGDLIRALAHLRHAVIDVSLSLIGAGDVQALGDLSYNLQVGDRVRFLGKRSHEQVQLEMREHDAVVVPSRHSYPEGLPMTLYEAMCSRTPILASDHPMFALRIRDGFNALVFRAESPDDLAKRIRDLMGSPATYESLSVNAETAAEHYLCPLKWDRLISAWLAGDHSTILSYAIAQMREQTAQLKA